MRRLSKLLLSTLLALAACGSSGSNVAVKGNDVDVTTLAGHWVGTYEGTDNPRKGTIVFDLGAGHHEAEGKVLMSVGPDQSQPLAVKFVEIEGGQLNGKIAPYTDPACKCELEAEFNGVMKGDTIKGTFEAKPTAGGPSQHGSWTVTRK